MTFFRASIFLLLSLHWGCLTAKPTSNAASHLHPSSSQLLHHTSAWVSPYVDSVVHIQTQFVKTHPLTFENTSTTAKSFVESFFDGDEPSFSTEVEGNAGTGFFIAPGLLATNDHVIDKAERIWVTTKDGRREKAHLIGRDERLDLALLKINILNIPPPCNGQILTMFRLEMWSPPLAILIICLGPSMWVVFLGILGPRRTAIFLLFKAMSLSIQATQEGLS